MSLPPSVIVPAEGVSSPATIRSVVVLPHPDGPSRAKNEPVGTSRSSDLTAVKFAKCLVRPRSSRPPEAVPVSGTAVSSATDDIRPVPFVLGVLLLRERHERERVLEVLLGGEDQRVVHQGLVDLLHLLLGAHDRTDVVHPGGELGR